jgi:V8-like Glu-specific endopeptidase
MKLWKILITLAVAAAPTLAMDKVVYGDDNRLDLFEVTNSMHLRLAKATAGKVANYNLEEQSNGTFKMTGSRLNVCEGDKFDNQITSATCSGFLVESNGKEYLVTAGHCINSASSCSSHKWVFDYSLDSADQTDVFVSKDSIYSCKRMVERKLDSRTGADYAVLELDRKVVGREPLKVRSQGTIPNGEEVLVIGHPTGLPSKVAGDAFVRDNSKSAYFETNLDTFAGNSGSAVFNARTGEVEGILVRGHTDYTSSRDADGSYCRTPVVCTMDSCRGEDVTKITIIEEFKK